mgnify:CR=1 FL=1
MSKECKESGRGQEETVRESEEESARERKRPREPYIIIALRGR